MPRRVIGMFVLFVALATALDAACGSAFFSLPQSQQTYFLQCRDSIRAARHDPNYFLDYDAYAHESEPGRVPWLARAGCERAIADEAADIHRRRASGSRDGTPPEGNPDDRRDLEAAHSDLRVETRVDEFTGEVTNVLEAYVAEGVSVTVLAAPGPPGLVAIFDVNSVSHDGWRYLDCHRLNMLVDGVPLAIPEAEHRGTVGRTYVLEHVWVPLTVEVLERLANAEVVRFRVCTSAFTMPSGFGAALRDLRSRATGETLTDAAAPPAEDLRARETAARDHGCALDTVTIGAEHDTGFWLNVCGIQRFYRREGDHFVEQPVPSPPTPTPTPQ